MPTDLIALTPACPPSIIVAPEELVSNTELAVLAVSTLPALTTNEECQERRELLLELAELAKLIEDQRTTAKAPFLAAGRAIDAEAQKLSVQVKACIATVKRGIAEYAMEVERRRILAAGEQAHHETAARLESAETGQTPRIVTSVVIPEAAPVQTRTDYHVEIVDESLIPRKYLRVDPIAILADLRSGTPVPGCKLATTRSVVSR